MRRNYLLGWTVVVFLLCSLGLQAQQADTGGGTTTSNSGSATSSISSLPAAGTIPRFVKFSGVVKDLVGNPATGSVGLIFSLYELPEGGTPLWTENQDLTLDALGHYTALLGANSPDGLPLDLFTSSKALWLGVQPQLPGAVEQPRVLLVAVPYALKSSDADTLGGLPASAFMLAPNAAANASSSPTITVPITFPPPPPVTPPGSTPPAGSITGSGVPNFAAMFTGGLSIGNSSIYNSPSGMVGIGTTNPAFTLDVFGTGRFNTSVSSALFNSSSVGQSLTVQAQNGTGNGGALTLSAGNAGGSNGGSGGNLTLTAGSAVPIGGAGYANQGTAGSVSIAAGGGYNGVGGNVTIQSGPNSNWSLTQNGFSQVSLVGPNLLSNDGAEIAVESAHNGSSTNAALSYGGNVRITAGNGNGGLSGGNIILSPGTGTPAGNVGIGTATPAHVLDVAGDINASTNINAGGNLTVGGTILGTGMVTLSNANNTFTGNGSGLIDLNPASLSAGTAGINISGNAANALDLGGVSAGSYARTDVGNTFAGTNVFGGSVGFGSSPNSQALVDINGTQTETSNNEVLLRIDGTLNSSPGNSYSTALGVYPTTTMTGYTNYNKGIDVALAATGSQIAHSVVAVNVNQPSAVNGSDCVVSFGINVPNQSAPCSAFQGTRNYGFFENGLSGTMNYFASPLGIGTATPQYTLDVQGTGNFTGIVNFAAGQTFPGTGTITGITTAAGSGLLGGGSSGALSLSVDPTVFLSLATATATYLPLAGGSVTGALNLSADLTLPATTGSSAGVINLGGAPFVQAYGTQNTFVGSGAGNFSTTGGSNTATGYQALSSVTSGGGNTASGLVALDQNTTGSQNTAGSAQAMYWNTTGSNNTASGWGALNHNSNGNNNTAVGFEAGAQGITGNTGIWNVSGSNNTYLGFMAGPADSGQYSNSTAIGANAVVGETNALVLGSINGVNGATSSVNVGIGTATPQYTLDVNGTGNFTGVVNFAAGQTFPGTGTITGITAGTGLSGGGNSGSVMLANTGLLGLAPGTGITSTGGQDPTLGIDTTVVPQLGGSNTFAGTNIFSSSVGFGSSPNSQALVDINGTQTETSFNEVLLRIDGTLSSSPGNSYSTGLGVYPTTTMTGYTNYNKGIDVSLAATGSGKAHSVVAVSVDQPSSVNSSDCVVSFGINVPNQSAPCTTPQPTPLNYGFFENGVSGTMNYFASPVGIGTATPGEMLDVVGNIRASGCIIASSSTVGGTCSSDERLKTRITPFQPSLDKLAELQPVQFNWRSTNPQPYRFGTGRSTGLIAQQVGKVFPEMVSTDARGYQQVNYTLLPFMLLEGVRELKARNDDLRLQVGKQQEQIANLNRRAASKDAEVAALAEQNRELATEVQQLRRAQEQTAALVARWEEAQLAAGHIQPSGLPGQSEPGGTVFLSPVHGSQSPVKAQ